MDFGVPLAYEIIPEFPSYLVSNRGEVVKEAGGKPMVMSPTQYGDLTVGLMKEGRQYRRSVKSLVARAFVEGETEIYDTPILKDYNRNNLHYKNIIWRPRWFAIAWTKQGDQLAHDVTKEWWFLGPVVDDVNGLVYTDFVTASLETGQLAKDILQSHLNGTKVFPSGHTFSLVT